MYHNFSIAIVIPYYNASKQIGRVIEKIPEYIDSVIVVDDKGKEILPKEEILEKANKKTQYIFLENECNMGVGGATKTGFNEALKQGHDIVIKVDADDQMDLRFIPDLLTPLIQQHAAVAKGNRFKDLKALQKMPFSRKFGNLGLSFLTKAATGYWHNFDPTNGFLAINTNTLKKIDFNKLDNRYYFETSLLAQLYFQEALIADIPMPAIYEDEKSNMNVVKMLFVFSKKLFITFIKRIVKRYFLYDFNIGSLYILVGLPTILFGLLFGIINWTYFASHGDVTPTGTIMITMLTIILGFQLLLQATQFDILNAPKQVKINDSN